MYQHTTGISVVVIDARTCRPTDRWLSKKCLLKAALATVLCMLCRLVYNPDRVPKTAEEWNNFPFVDKTHIGFYGWPK